MSILFELPAPAQGWPTPSGPRATPELAGRCFRGEPGRPPSPVKHSFRLNPVRSLAWKLVV